MYKISYEKCVCFIFLVILAVLSCSGFRIDNLAMTDISKRNSYTSNSYTNQEYFARIFNQRTHSADSVSPNYHHRIRHQRQLRAQAHTLRRHDTPTGYIDAKVFPHGAFPLTTQTNEHFAQIPSTSSITKPFVPTKPIITRSQRSSTLNRRGSKKLCQREHITRKIYNSKIVVHAKAQSKPSQSKEGDLESTVQFSVIKIYKNNSSLPVDDHMSITFHKDYSNNCERYRISLTKEYILFLNSPESHNYSVMAAPVKVPPPKKRGKMLKTVRTISSPNFKARPPKVISVVNNSTKPHRLKLVCTTRGLPIPYITWTKNGKELHTNSSIKIIYKKRRSTLVVKNVNDTAKYECIARGVYDQVDVKAYQPPNSESVDCGPKEAAYCMNGGTCRNLTSMGETMCLCPDHYTGNRCEVFAPVSTYNQPTQTACKLGLQTRYFC